MAEIENLNRDSALRFPPLLAVPCALILVDNKGGKFFSHVARSMR